MPNSHQALDITTFTTSITPSYCCFIELKSWGSPLVVSKRLGHSKVSITLDTYGQLLPGMQQETANYIDGLVTLLEMNLHTNCKRNEIGDYELLHFLWRVTDLFQTTFYLNLARTYDLQITDSNRWISSL